MLKKVFALACTLLLISCVSSQEDFEGTRDMPPNFSRVRGVPIPEKSTMDLGQTLIFGGGQNWVGRLNFSAPYNAAGIFDFYVKEMPGYGWTQLSSIRGDPSILTYQKAERIATIQITSSTMRGTSISMIISNKDMTMQSNANLDTSSSTTQVGASAAGIPVYKSSTVSQAGSLAIPEEASNRNYSSSSRGVEKLVN